MATATFVDGTFDAIVDKGGLDAVMEPELGPKLGSQYLSEIQQRYQDATSYLPFVFEGSSPSAGKFEYLGIRRRWFSLSQVYQNILR
ncbi:hypothetical protein LguiB_005763 [Lonicera macranthoides]